MGIRYRHTSLQVQYDRYHGFSWFGTIGPLSKFAWPSWDIVDRYDRGFAGSRIHPLAHKTDSVESSRHLYITHVEGASLEERNLIIQELAKAGIASNVHYKPLPLLTAYKNLGFDMANYPKAYAFFENEITLPLHTKLSDEEVDYIIETFKTVSEKY